MQARRALALAILLAVPLAVTGLAQAAPEDPLVVALDNLPVALRSAIRQAQNELLTDEADAQLAATQAYVDGFGSLEGPSGALADAELAQAYAWTEEVVNLVLQVPRRMGAVEQAAADCAAYFAPNATRSKGLGTVQQGVTGLNELDLLRDRLRGLLEAPPAAIPVDAVHLTQSLLDDWLLVRGVIAQECLVELANELDVQAPDLFAVLLPDWGYRTGQFAILGRTARTSIQIASPGLGLDVRPNLSGGRFRIDVQIPRDAPLGNNSIRVSDGQQHIDLVLHVRLAPVTLLLDAPSRVRMDQEFAVAVTAVSPLGRSEVDRARSELHWRGNDILLTLRQGQGGTNLDSGSPGRFALEVRTSSTDVLQAASRTVTVVVVDDVAAASQAESSPKFPPTLDPRLSLEGSSWWIFLVLLLLILALILLGIEALRRARQRERRGLAPEQPGRPMPEGISLLVGTAMMELRRMNRLPPGRTPREWITHEGGPDFVADAFDATRYGDFAEVVAPPRTQGWLGKIWPWRRA